MMKPEPRLLTPPGSPKRSSGGSSKGRSCGSADSPAAGSGFDSVEMLTTVGLSVAANWTKSGRVSALICCGPPQAESIHSRSASAKAAAAATIAAASTIPRAQAFSRTANIRYRRRRVRLVPRRLDVLHAQVEQDRAQQPFLVRIKITTGFVLEHSKNVDHVLGGR